MSVSEPQQFRKKPIKIKRALISVFDKTGLIELAKGLHSLGIEIISTGGSFRAVQNAGIPVTAVNDVTNFPEILEGRVKTLHPAIHGGILGRPGYEADLEQLNQNDISPIELVVCNLYPFQEIIAKEGVTDEKAYENIDIGGPAMIRAAAKNVDYVTVLGSPSDYADLITELLQNDGRVSYDSRRKLSAKAFQQTAAYDAAISRYLNISNIADEHHPKELNINLGLNDVLRYGENPHQSASVYGSQNDFIDCIHGKQLSYNNYLDLDAALHIMADFKHDEPTVAIIKHTLPCGVATASTLKQAWDNAFATDTMSPFGGIVVANHTLDLETAKEIDSIFTEIIVAPAFSDDALELLRKKANRRLVLFSKLPDSEFQMRYRSIFGGVLSQQPDSFEIDVESFKCVSKRKPTNAELNDMIFAWKVVKRVNSNAIVFAKDKRTLGIGSGQPSRIDSSEIAVSKADKFGLDLTNSVIASDAFFPFADGVEAAAKAGARIVIQPGGSVRDEEVIAMADKYNMTMIFTGQRHFKH